MTLDTQAVYDRYAATFATKDPEAIAENHAQNGTFWLHNGGDAVQGRDAIAATFGHFFASWPEFGFQVRRLILAPQHWVLDWVITAVLPSSTGGRSIRIDALDVIDVDSAGLVTRKDTWIDGAQLRVVLSSNRS
jgi:uncharacterized protein (TIGR02246 family)